eukprot:COSAG01_NODE_64380_length_276_cov_2.355932_1_plen_30_part_01
MHGGGVALGPRHALRSDTIKRVPRCHWGGG